MVLLTLRLLHCSDGLHESHSVVAKPDFEFTDGKKSEMGVLLFCILFVFFFSLEFSSPNSNHCLLQFIALARVFRKALELSNFLLCAYHRVPDKFIQVR